MDYAKRHNILFTRERFSDLVPVNAYEAGLFFMEGDRDYIGACFVGSPLIGADESTVEMIRSGLSGDCPDDTLIQVSYLSSSYIENLIKLYSTSRLDLKKRADGLTHEQKNTLWESFQRRREMLQGAARKPLVRASGVRMKNTTIVLSVKIPVSKTPTERELETVDAAIMRIEQSFKTIGLAPQRLDATQYLILLRSILFMGAEPDRWYDQDKLIKEQLLPYDAGVECQADYVKVKDTYIRSLSTQAFPESTHLGVMNQLIGDPLGSHNQIADPFMFTMNIYFPAQVKKMQEVRQKENAINYQSQGPWFKFVARLRSKKEGFDVLSQSIEEGNRPIMLWFNVLLFSDNAETSARAAATLRTYFQIFGYEMHEDRYTHAPMMLQQMPLFPEVEAVRKSFRYHTMTIREAAHMLPIIGEWKGSGRGGAITLAGRRGQVLLYDLFDSTTNYNAVIAAESGAGKSFLANDLIMSYLQQGAVVRIVDQGGSYEKLCEGLDGEYIVFDDAHRICLNPFTHVQDIDEELSLLKVIVAKMAAPTQGFNDWEMAQTEVVIKDVWDHVGNQMSITDVAEAMLRRAAAEEEPRLRNMAQQLHSFTRHGIYRRYFDGPNTLNYKNNLVVLELDQLRSKKHLQQVVMLQLIAQLQTECYLGDRNVKKVIILDEAWELFEDPIVAQFLQGAYRRFRKYGSSCVIITQSLNDLYQSASGEAIANNSNNVIVLRQNAEAIAGLKKSGRFNIGEYGYEQLNSLHTEPGQYSDVMFRSGSAWGVGRFVVERFSQLLYSTSPKEVAALKALRESGMSISEAINHYIAMERGEPPPARVSVAKSAARGEGGALGRAATGR
jgi:conjugal transfer ATP-binding protein TraC